MQSDSRPYGEKQNQEDREQIVVRPSPEFIPDEYHFSIEKVRVDIFRNPQDASISQKLIETFQLIGYSVDIDSNVHDLNSSTNLKNDLDSSKYRWRHWVNLTVVVTHFHRRYWVLMAHALKGVVSIQTANIVWLSNELSCNNVN